MSAIVGVLLFVLLALASPSWAALSLDGSGEVLGTSGCNPCNIGSFSTTGPGIVYVAITSNGGLPTSVTGCSLTFTLRKQQTAGSGNDSATYSAVSSSALSSCVVALNYPGPSGFLSATAFGVKGANTTTIWDTNASIPAGAATAIVSVSTDAANTFIISLYRFNTQPGPTSGTGFTQISGGDSGFHLVQYKIVSTPQSSLSLAIGTGDGDEDGGIGDAIVSGGGQKCIGCGTDKKVIGQ